MSQPIPPSAADWNNLFNLTVFVAVAALAIVMGAMVYFTIKYRKKKGQDKFVPEVGLSRSRARDAIIFALISIIILTSLLVASYRLTPNARFPPSSQSLTIDVTAFQWAFRFTYPNGASTLGVVNVPANTSIIFNITSLDVMHNFYLADYRVSIDAIQGKYNIIWISTPQLDGYSQLNYTIRCKELCGVWHYDMTAQMVVMDPISFRQWLNNQTTTATNTTITGAGG
jgi:cytochrome c oxidase subunit 2